MCCLLFLNKAPKSLTKGSSCKNISEDRSSKAQFKVRVTMILPENLKVHAREFLFLRCQSFAIILHLRTLLLLWYSNSKKSAKLVLISIRLTTQERCVTKELKLLTVVGQTWKVKLLNRLQDSQMLRQTWKLFKVGDKFFRENKSFVSKDLWWKLITSKIVAQVKEMKPCNRSRILSSSRLKIKQRRKKKPHWVWTL